VLLPEQVGVWDREKGRPRNGHASIRERQLAKFGQQHAEEAAHVLIRQTGRPSGPTFAADVLPIIEDIRAGGVTSLNGVAEELNRRGVGTPRGGRWAAMTVRRVVERGSGTSEG